MTDLDTTLAQVRAARVGDRAALEDLFARYLPWVVRTVALRLGKRLQECTDLEDLAQESLLDAFRSIDRFQERSEATFRNWLARIVEHNVRDAARRQRSRRTQLAEPLPELETATSSGPQLVARDPRPSEVAAGHELEARLEAAMLRLSERHRELLILRDRCGMGYDEVARELQLKNEDTARALHHRALQQLARSLEPG